MTKFFAAACLAVGLLPALPSRAAITILSNSVFNVGTNDYTYSYSVMNSSDTFDGVLVSIPAFAPLGITNIMAPMGFTLTYDPSQMWVNLQEDGSIITPETFAPMTTVSGFSFRSTAMPGAGIYSAFDASGLEFNGSASAPVPEPSGLLLGALVGLGAFCRRRR